MDNPQLLALCKTMNLGLPISPPRRVHGGLIHNMWHIETTMGLFAVKELNSRINFDSAKRAEYELSERIAREFTAAGIPAICAIFRHDVVLAEIERRFYMCYPWVEAKALTTNQIEPQKALIMASLLAKIHNLKLHISGVRSPEYDFCSDLELENLINFACRAGLSFSHQLQSCKNRFLEINHRYQNAMPLLQKNWVVSHHDLDQKNVLWDNQSNPFIVDWESAGPVNPTYEAIKTALEWSGITTKTLNIKLFEQMIQRYQLEGGTILESEVEAALYGICGGFLNWLVFNLKRSLDEKITSEERQLGIEQVEEEIQTIAHLELNMKFIERVLQN